MKLTKQKLMEIIKEELEKMEALTLHQQRVAALPGGRREWDPVTQKPRIMKAPQDEPIEEPIEEPTALGLPVLPMAVLKAMTDDELEQKIKSLFTKDDIMSVIKLKTLNKERDRRQEKYKVQRDLQRSRSTGTPFGGIPVEEKLSSQELIGIIEEELSDYLSNIYKWCPSGSKCAPEKKKTKWWKGR